MSGGQTLYDLVVVGSSAGGIDALSLLVSTLPTDFPSPLVLIASATMQEGNADFG